MIPIFASSPSCSVNFVQFCPVEDPDPTVRCALAHASTIISPWGDESMTTAASHEEERVCGYGAQRW